MILFDSLQDLSSEPECSQPVQDPVENPGPSVGGLSDAETNRSDAMGGQLAHVAGVKLMYGLGPKGSLDGTQG